VREEEEGESGSTSKSKRCYFIRRFYN